MPEGSSATALRSFAVLVLVVGRNGVPLVQEQAPRLGESDCPWKLPGGKAREEEKSALAAAQSDEERVAVIKRAAARELDEETGIGLDPEGFELLCSLSRSGSRGEFDIHILGAHVQNHLEVYARGNRIGNSITGELTKIVPFEKLYDAIELWQHREHVRLREVEEFLQSCQ